MGVCLGSFLPPPRRITNGLVEVPQEYHPAPRLQNTTRGHTMQFQGFQPVVDAFKYAFLPRTIPAWNALPQLVAEADSLDTFKQHMSRHQQFWLSAFCTMHLVHICFTVHLFIAGFYTTLRHTVFRRCWSLWPRSTCSVLSFEGRCYLLIQIQIQICNHPCLSVCLLATLHKTS